LSKADISFFSEVVWCIAVYLFFMHSEVVINLGACAEAPRYAKKYVETIYRFLKINSRKNTLNFILLSKFFFKNIINVLLILSSFLVFFKCLLPYDLKLFSC